MAPAFKALVLFLAMLSTSIADEGDDEWEEVVEGVEFEEANSVTSDDFLYEPQLSPEGREVLIITPDGFESSGPDYIEPTNDYLD